MQSFFIKNCTKVPSKLYVDEFELILFREDYKKPKDLTNIEFTFKMANKINQIYTKDSLSGYFNLKFNGKYLEKSKYDVFEKHIDDMFFDSVKVEGSGNFDYRFYKYLILDKVLVKELKEVFNIKCLFQIIVDKLSSFL